MFRVADAYFNVLDAEADLRAAEANKKATARQLEQAKQRFEVGLIAITDVHETQAAYDGANTDVIVSRNAIDTAWEALLEIIGSHPREDLAQLQDPIDLAKPEPADLDQWAETALEQNLLIESAFRSAELARKNIELQRSGHYPTLDLVGSYGTLDNSDSNRGSRSNLGVIGLELNVPLYQGGGVSSAVRQARYDFEAAQDNLEAQRRSVNRTVKDAFRGVDTSISAVQSLAATVVSSKSALEATEAGYEVGTRTIIDVLNVQRNLFESERNYAKARYRYVRSGLLLKQAASILSPDDIAAVNGMLK
jgi:outer membrane protein